MTRETIHLTHASVTLALHRLTADDQPGRPLLLVHGLGEHTPDEVPPHLRAWPGPVWGLDLTGHGESSIPDGGGYTAEILMADVDHALTHLGEVTLFGRGLGAYLSLLAAGARPDLVTGAILADGTGIDGGSQSPHSPALVVPAAPARTGTPDPFALAELSGDVRPADYASIYARQALEFSGLDTPIVVAAVTRPPWLAAIVDEPGVATATIPDALNRFANLTRPA